MHLEIGFVQDDSQVLATEFQLAGFATVISPSSERSKKQLTAEQLEADDRTGKSPCISSVLVITISKFEICLFRTCTPITSRAHTRV